MMDHDRLFKELLRNFFIEFLELFLPEVRAYLRADSIEFLDKEIITDVDARERHEVDLLVKARLRDQDVCVLIHVENQAHPQEDFARRMFRYFARLYEKYGLPVYPIVIFSYDSPQRPEPDRFQIAFPDKIVLDFRFTVIQLNRLNWRDFARQPNPVAAALMAKMKIAPEDRVKAKLECLRLLVTLRLDRARMRLISIFVDSYLRLNAQEERMMQEELAELLPVERQGIMEMTTSWEERGLARGHAQAVIRILRKRFGQVPTKLSEDVATLTTDRLAELLDASLDFANLAEAEAWVSAQAGAK